MFFKRNTDSSSQGKNRYSDYLDANSRNNMTVHMKTIMGNIKIILFLNITPFLCINYHLIWNTAANSNYISINKYECGWSL